MPCVKVFFSSDNTFILCIAFSFLYSSVALSLFFQYRSLIYCLFNFLSTSAFLLSICFFLFLFLYFPLSQVLYKWDHYRWEKHQTFQLSVINFCSLTWWQSPLHSISYHVTILCVESLDLSSCLLFYWHCFSNGSVCLFHASRIFCCCVSMCYGYVLWSHVSARWVLYGQRSGLLNVY